MESSQLNPNHTNIPEYKPTDTPHQNSEITLTEAQIRMEKQMEDGFNYILTILNTQYQNISAIFNSLTEKLTKLTERVATTDKKTDVLLKMQDHRYFMDTLLQNSKKDINIALNSLYANDCQELKTILQFAAYDTKWAYELKSVLGLNKKYFYTDNNPLAASLRKSCQINDHQNLNLSSIDSEKKPAKELDYDKKTIIEDMVKCITEAISAEMYNAESKKVLIKLCDEVTANISKMFPKTTTFNLFPEDLSKAKEINELGETNKANATIEALAETSKANATIAAIAEKIDTMASNVNELKESHNELKASLLEDTQKK